MAAVATFYPINAGTVTPEEKTIPNRTDVLKELAQDDLALTSKP